MKSYVYVSTLKDNSEAIEQYKSMHKSIPDDVIKNIPDNGIIKMDIYLLDRRLVNIIETDDDFDPITNIKRENAHPSITAWDEATSALMENLPNADTSKSWVLMEHIYHRERLEGYKCCRLS